MKVTIITAVRNGEMGIAATLKSVCEQDYGLIEHIIVDGASSDNTVGVVRANAERVAQLISEPDGGVYEAFNKGLRHSTGEVVAFLNAGDVYTSANVVSRMVRELLHSDTQAVFGDALIVDRVDETRVVRRYSSNRFSPRAMAFGIMPAHPTLFLRRQVYREAGEYDSRFRIAGDFELCLRVFVKLAVKYRYVPQPLVRMPRGGLSNSGWRSKMLITREMLSACAMNGVRTNWVKLCLRLPLKALEMI